MTPEAQLSATVLRKWSTAALPSSVPTQMPTNRAALAASPTAVLLDAAGGGAVPVDGLEDLLVGLGDRALGLGVRRWRPCRPRSPASGPGR